MIDLLEGEFFVFFVFNGHSCAYKEIQISFKCEETKVGNKKVANSFLNEVFRAEKGEMEKLYLCKELKCPY